MVKKARERGRQEPLRTPFSSSFDLKQGRPPHMRTAQPISGRADGSSELLSQIQLCDDGTVTLDVHLLEVAQEVTAVTDHLQKTPTAVVILHVGSQVLGQGVDAVGQDRDLNLGGACVTLVDGILLDDCLLFCCGHGNFTFLLHKFGIGTATGR